MCVTFSYCCQRVLFRSTKRRAIYLRMSKNMASPAPIPASHLSAIELLKKGEDGRELPLLNKYWPEVLGTTFGVCMGVFLNYQTRRPSFSGIQKHFILGAGFIGLLNYAQNKRNGYLAEKDAVYRHYIELHPEDFPEPPRKKIADIIEPWVPVR